MDGYYFKNYVDLELLNVHFLSIFYFSVYSSYFLVLDQDCSV